MLLKLLYQIFIKSVLTRIWIEHKCLNYLVQQTQQYLKSFKNILICATTLTLNGFEYVNFGS